MTTQGIIIPDHSAELRELKNQLEELNRKLDSVLIAPKPEWLTVHAYAAYVGRSSRTVNRMITEGRIEMRVISGAKMVRVEV
jgi:hypothetical protein